MFKKRAPKAPIVTPPPQGDDDDDATSPTITVSIPQDALDHQETPNRSHSTSSSRRSSIDVKHHVHQPPMPWKPWNPQKIEVTGTSGTSSDPEVHRLAAISSTATSTTSHVSGTGTRIGKGTNGLKSPSMMLNIGGMFSSSSTTTTPGTPGSASSTTSQPVEARLWNAELSDPSPLSPAVPRYIPAIAGSGATGSRKMNFGGSRKSLEGYGSPNGGFRGLGQASSHSSTNQDRPPHQHHQSSSSFSRAPSTTSRSGSDKSKSKSTKTQSRYLSGASPPNKMLRDGSDITTFTIPNATSPVVQDTHRAVIFKDKSRSRGQSSNGHYQGYESTRKICREDHDLRIRSFDFSEATEPDFYGDGLDGLGTDYDDDDNRKRDRRSFSRSNVGSARFGALLRNPTRFMKARMFSLRYHRRRVHPCVRFSVLILLAGCVCFTTIQLIFYRGSENGRRASFKKAIGKRAKDLQLGGLLIGPTKPKRRISVFDVEAQNYSSQQWELETHNIQGCKCSFLFLPYISILQLMSV